MTVIQEIEAALGKRITDLTRTEAIALLQKILGRLQASVDKQESLKEARRHPPIRPLKRDAAEAAE